MNFHFRKTIDLEPPIPLKKRIWEDVKLVAVLLFLATIIYFGLTNRSRYNPDDGEGDSVRSDYRFVLSPAVLV